MSDAFVWIINKNVLSFNLCAMFIFNILDLLMQLADNCSKEHENISQEHFGIIIRMTK